MDWVQRALAGLAIIVPLLLGIFARNERHAILKSISVGIVCTAIIGTYAIFYRGVHVSAPGWPLKTLVAIGTGATISGFVGWIANRLATPFRTELPRVALRKAAYFVLSLVLKAAALAIVIDALGNVAIVDFAQAPLRAIYYVWKGYLYPYVALALLIVFAWSARSSRAPSGGTISTPRLVLFRVVPLAAITLLFLPIAMAWVEVVLSIRLLDCPPLINDTDLVITSMVDYTFFILNSLAWGAVFDNELQPTIFKCVPAEGALLGSALSLGLRLTPGLVVAWLFLRSNRLRT
jgi:hypothetical protein